MPGFEVDQLISDLSDAIAETEPRRAVKDVLERAVADPGAMADALRPTEGGLTMLHQADDITVAHVVWAPGMTIFPHDHRMWAALCVYTGWEDNAFFRRPAPDATTIVESGGKRLQVGDTVVLGADTIHGVSSSPDAFTAAIHVYGGDFPNTQRSGWGPGERVERPYDAEEAARIFAAANDAWQARRTD